MSNLNMSNITNFLCLLIFLNVIYYFDYSQAAKAEYVTCGSVFKLFNTDFRVRLHSHDVKYGTGSGQQSVTGTEVQEDSNSHWLVRGPTDKHCSRGDPIKCGDTIRLQHLATNKNLHSHHFQSPLSGNQEISCYGDEQGEGDSGDHWMVVCGGNNWTRDGTVKLRHIDTNKYLATSGRTFGRPISGQAEIVGVASATGSVDWQVMEGLFIHPTDLAAKHAPHHTEL